MERQELKKLIKKEFDGLLNSYGYYQIGTSQYWFREKNHVLGVIAFEPVSSGYRTVYAVDPLYYGHTTLGIAHGSYMDREKRLDHKLYDLDMDASDEKIYENIDRIKSFFISEGFKTLSDYCDPKVLTNLKFGVSCDQLNAYSKLYTEDYEGAYKWFETEIKKHHKRGGRECDVLHSQHELILSLLENKNRKELVTSFLKYQINISRNSIIGFKTLFDIEYNAKKLN